jgi:predicted RNA binding protein YcfA (HicA-like mRNA interferase family)
MLWRVAKGAQLRKALEKRFAKIRQRGSHITFRIGPHEMAIYAFHDSRDLGERHLRMVAKDFGLTLDELKRLL